MKTGTKISKMHERVNTAKEERAELGPMNDVKIAENTFWDDANSLYLVSKQAIATSYGELTKVVKEIIEDPEKLATIKEPNILLQNIKLVTRDVSEHLDRLDNIYATHKDKTGGTKNPDDHIAVLHTNGQYADALSIYDSVVMPTVAHIFEQIGGAQELLTAQHMQKMLEEKQKLADVNVVSDVPVKEIIVDAGATNV
jgi:hypothetical protein